MQRFGYRVVVEWSNEDDAFVARVPAVGAYGHGDSAEDAVREAQIGARGILDSLRAHGRPLPPEDAAPAYSGRVLVRMPSALHSALADRADADGVSLNQEIVAMLAGAAGAKRRVGRAVVSDVRHANPVSRKRPARSERKRAGR
jgi:predicted RNase H-like HicB family nuclease